LSTDLDRQGRQARQERPGPTRQPASASVGATPRPTPRLALVTIAVGMSRLQSE